MSLQRTNKGRVYLQHTHGQGRTNGRRRQLINLTAKKERRNPSKRKYVHCVGKWSQSSHCCTYSSTFLQLTECFQNLKDTTPPKKHCRREGKKDFLYFFLFHPSLQLLPSHLAFFSCASLVAVYTWTCQLSSFALSLRETYVSNSYLKILFSLLVFTFPVLVFYFSGLAGPSPFFFSWFGGRIRVSRTLTLSLVPYQASLPSSKLYCVQSFLAFFVI